MSVYKALRGDSSVQFVGAARKRWNSEGRVIKIAGKFARRVFPLSDIRSAYESWHGHMKRGNSFHAVKRMDLYFKKLFGFHPNNKIEWRKALCT